MFFLLVTTRADELARFMDGLAEAGVKTVVVESKDEALDAVRAKMPDLVVVDRDLPGIGSLALVLELLKVNAMVNTAVVSDLSEEEFHEESEGLGVLSRVPPTPLEDDAKELVDKLRGLPGC